MSAKPRASAARWAWAIVLQLLGIAALYGLWVAAAQYFPPLFILWAVALFPILRLTGGPFNTLAGLYNYQSDFAFTWKPREGELEVHLGGSYDYPRLWHVSGGRARAKRVLMGSALETLAALARQAREGAIPPATRITMATYFLDERTVARFGFRPEKVGLGDKFMFIMSIGDLWVLNWLLTGKKAPPPLLSLVRCATTAGELAGHAVQLGALARRMMEGSGSRASSGEPATDG